MGHRAAGIPLLEVNQADVVGQLTTLALESEGRFEQISASTQFTT